MAPRLVYAELWCDHPNFGRSVADSRGHPITLDSLRLSVEAKCTNVSLMADFGLAC